MTQFYTHSSAGTIIGTAGAEGEWWSGTFNFDRVVPFVSVRCHREMIDAATGSIDVIVNNQTIGITSSGTEYPIYTDYLNVIRAQDLWFKIVLTEDAIVSKIEFFEQSVVPVNETTTIKKGDIDTCRSFVIEHAKADAPCYIHTATHEGELSVRIDGTFYSGKIPRTLTKAKQHTMHIDSDGFESCTVYMRRTVKVPKHIHIVNDGPVLPWLIERYEVPENSRIASVLVIGGGGTMNVYFNGDNNPVEFTVSNGVETPATGTSETSGQRQRFGSLELDFGASLNGPSSVHIFLVESIMVDGPVILENPEHQTGLFFHFKKLNRFMVQKIGYSQNFTSISRAIGTPGVVSTTDVGMQEVSYVQTSGGLKIHSIGLWPLIDEPNDGIIRETAELSDMPPWEYKRYVFDKPRIVTGGSYSGSGGSVAVYGDSDNLLGSIPSPGQEFPFTLGTPTRSVTIQTSAIDGFNAISVFTKEVVEIDEKGFSKTGGDGWVNMFAAFPIANRFVCGRVLGTSPTLIVNGLTIALVGYLAKFPSRQAVAITHQITVLDTHPEQLTLLPLTIQPVKGNKVRVVNDGFIPEWMHTKYELEGTDRLTSVYVKGASIINLYLDGAEAGTALPVTDGVETVIPAVNGRCGAFQFDFADDSAVTEVIFWADPMRIIGQDDILLEGEDHWMGRRFKFPDRGEWACVSVGADASVAMTLTCDDTPASNQSATLPDGFMVALPRGKEGSAWTLSLDAGTNKIYNFVAKARTRMPVNETIVRITGQRKEIHPWWYGRWDIPADRKLTGIIVDADESVSGTIYGTGANPDSQTFTAADNHEIRITTMNDVSSVDVVFTAGEEYAVNEAYLVFQQERLVPQEGIVLENEISWRSLRFSFQEKNRFAVAAVKAESYTGLNMDIYRNGTRVDTIDILNGNPVIISGTTDDVHWEVDLYYTGSPNGNINSLTLMPFITKAIEDDTYVMKQKGLIAEWLYTRYEVPKKQKIKSCYVSTTVATDTNTRIVITPYPGTTVTTPTTPYVETKLDIPACGAFTFKIENRPDTTFVLCEVDDVILHMERHIPIENRHTIIRDISPREGIRNRIYRFTDTGCFCAIRVVADDYDSVIEVTPYADGVAQNRIDITDGNLTDLDQTMPNAKDWEMDIESAATIREIHLLTKEEEPYNGTSWVIKRDQSPYSWRHHRTVAPKPMEFSCARILADAYPVELQIFNVDNGLVYKYSVKDAEPFRLRKEQHGRVWRVDVTGAPEIRIFEVGLATSMKGLPR